MRPVTPRGFRDVLFDEAREREEVVRAVTAVFDSWGYEPVETPVVESYRTLETGVGPLAGTTAFRLFDLDGSLLALRPEMTVPVARLVSTRLSEAPGPHRLRYVADVFREQASLRGQARQFTQIGVELVGARGPAADVEVVALLVAALEAAGLASFTVAIGSAEVLRGLLDVAGGPEAWREAVIAAAHDRNLVEIDRLAARDDLAPEVAEAFRAVPRLTGGAEALARCDELVGAAGCGGTVCDLRETWRVLESLGLGDRVRLDFGIMRSFGYYTGLQVEAYAPGLGVPLGGGGRYDRLLAAFGQSQPAAGFALGLERVMIALAEQGRSPRPAPLDAVLGGTEPQAVFAAASRLRAAGWRVRLAVGRTGAPLVREADRAGAAEALVADARGLARVDRAGERAEPLGDPLPAPPRRSWAAAGGEPV
jgi:ATP phosphoribosyltransferase regulatory subunit